MNRRRTTTRTLTGSRIYIRGGKFKYFASEPILNPKTGILAKWHILCPVEEGELLARKVLSELLGYEPKGKGDFCAWFDKWRNELLAKREKESPRDPVRKAIWIRGTQSLINTLGVIENAFADFDIHQARASDVALFVDQWEGRRAAQTYRGHLSAFFAWCCRRGILDTNPAREVTLVAPKKRKTYLTNEHYTAVRQDLLKGSHNRKMVACLMDMYYLLYQRGTDVRLLPANALDGGHIEFTPTKTEKTSGTRVTVPVTDEMRQIVESIKAIRKIRSTYLFHDEHGQPFTARRVRDIFKRTCDRVGIKDITLKDIRSKAATDAAALGYSEKQIQVALAHSTGKTTSDYIRPQTAPVSEVVLRLPK
ncbi:MAG: tyrosine-type recombinase/integrase [Methylobacillus sp.]|jgi:integrase|nr:tyrosine-type recombinase/integrase [Methylobacillus sp.]